VKSIRFIGRKWFVVLTITLLGIAVLLCFVISQWKVNREIQAQWQEEPAIVPQLAVTKHLEIIPLYEEASNLESLFSGHGVSYLIRTDSGSVLLDVGNNFDQSSIAPFLQNLQSLGIAWDEVTRIVISHLHPDHVGGKQAWQGHTIAIGNMKLPDDLDGRLVFVPAPVTFKNAIHATIPTLPAPDIATTGVISYLEKFPLSLFPSKGEEQALVVHVEGKGLVLITGCGHPGMKKLVERAEKVYEQTVVGIVGGLHYEKMESVDVFPQIQFLQTRPIELIALSPHDSSPEALTAFEEAFREAYQSVSVGESIHLP